MKRAAYAKIREVYWQSCRHEGVLNIYIYRRISIWLAVLAERLRLTPNQVTVLSFISSMIAGVLFLPGNFALDAWALVPFHFGKILDCADGQLARLSGQSSEFGAFLDPFLDRITDSLLLVALAIGYQRHTGLMHGVYLVLALHVVWFWGAYLSSYGNSQLFKDIHQNISITPLLLRRLL